ncbi:MFGE8 [Branchiostoma lanceolatum]|uniref:MFGE8 protein n=1 Tax=Branchiostoma lanceolatum TaxID=7740 RepID=A0A8K0F2Y6_BRALA|nr:MFGE8 [Branchiostoma lanceolatum]
MGMSTGTIPDDFCRTRRMGMSTRVIPDDSVTSATPYDHRFVAANGRFGTNRSWLARSMNMDAVWLKRAGLPSDLLLNVYVSFIRPIMEYASPVLGGLPKTLSSELEKIQKLCCKLIGIEHHKLPTLQSRRHEASVRELRRILDDPTHPCRQFLPPVVKTAYSLRRHVDLGQESRVYGVITQGRPDYGQWARTYKLSFSTDGGNWTTYADTDGSDKLFQGNYDRSSPVYNFLDSPVTTRHVQFHPRTYQSRPVMRVEVLGCPTEML